MTDSLIFISYSHKDNSFVKKAISALELQNYNIWYDAGLEGGSAYNNEIATRIKNCDCFIAFMSGNYAASDYCITELEYALKRKKDIFVAYIDDINEEELPAGIEMHISRLQAKKRKDYATDNDFIKIICNEPIVERCKIRLSESENAQQKTSQEIQKETQQYREEKNAKTFDSPTMRGKDFLYDDEEYSFVYYGEVFDGWRHGYGKCVWSNGDVYEGDWLEGKRTGKGKMTYFDGDVYDGDWMDDKVHGFGKYNWSTGNYYEGEWMNNNRHGRGKMTYPWGDVYDGEWKFGKHQGWGKMSYSNGSEYEGEWKNNVRHGVGRLKRTNGTYKNCHYINGEEQYGTNSGIY